MRPRIGYENLLINFHLVTRDALKVYSLNLRHDLSVFHSRLAKNFVWLYDRLVQLKLWAKRLASPSSCSQDKRNYSAPGFRSGK